MTKSQPHRCYLVLSFVLIIIILLSTFNAFTSNDGKATTLSYSPGWSYWPYIGFTHIVLVKYVTNTFLNTVVVVVVLRLNVPVNNFSVMSGRSHRFLGN